MDLSDEGALGDRAKSEAIVSLSPEIQDTALWNDLIVPRSSGKLLACIAKQLPWIARDFSPEHPLDPV